MAFLHWGEKMAKTRRISYYYKYLISYIIILTVPIVFIGAYVSTSIFNTLEQEVIINETNTLHRVKVGIDGYHTRMKSIKEDIHLKSNGRGFFLEEDPLRARAFIEDIREYHVTNPFLEDIMVYYCGDDYIYTATGTASLEIFTEELFVYQEWDMDKFIETINTAQDPVYRPVENVILNNGTKEHEYATVIYPITSASKEPYAMAIFIISKDYFEVKINDIVEENHNTTLLLDDKGQRILSTADTEFESILDEALSTEGTLSQYLTEVDNDNRTHLDGVIELQGEAYIIANTQSDISGWEYLSLTPINSIREKTRRVRFGFSIGIVMVVVFGVLAIILFMKVNYNPIKSLKKYSQTIYEGEGRSQSEFEVVRSAMDYLSDQNDQLSNEVAYSNEANKQYVTMQILKSGITNEGQLKKNAKKYGIVLEEFCTVAIIYINSDADYANTKKEILAKLDKDFFNKGHMYRYEHLDHRKISLILSYNEAGILDLRSELDKVISYIRDELKVSCSLGVGKQYRDKQLIPKAYIEAFTAVDYRLVKGNGCVIYYEDIVEQQVALADYPQGNLINVGNFLKKGNIQAIEKEVDIMIKYLKSHNTPIFIAKGLCFDMINMIVRTSHELVGEFHSASLDIPDVFVLSQYETIDELASVIKELGHDLCIEVIKQKEKDELSLIHEMVVYLKNNYTDPNFSLNGMADFFGMSQSSLSMYFKEKTDQKINDYLTRMKIDKAKDLLVTTKIPLSKLSEAVGYNNVTSFIRRFKQWEEITPGEYRKKYS